METFSYPLDLSGDKSCMVQLLKGDESFYVWIGAPHNQASEHRMCNLTTAIQTRFDEVPMVSNLVTDDTERDEWSTSIAVKMSKALKMQILVSCSLPLDYGDALSDIEKKLLDLMKALV